MKTTHPSNRFGSVAFWGYLITSPLIVYGIQIPYAANLRFARIFLMLCAFATIAHIVTRPFVRSVVRITTFEVVIAFVSIYALLSNLWSADEVAWSKRFWGWLECIFIYFSALWFCQDKNSLEKAIRVYIFSGLFVLYVCYWQFLNVWTGNFQEVGVPFPQLALLDFYTRMQSSGAFGVALGAIGDISRLAGTFNDPNILAGYLSSLFCLLTIASNSKRSLTITSVIYYVFLLGTTVAIFLTFSKSGLIATTLGVLIIVSQGSLSRKIRVFTIGLLLIVGALVFVIFPEMVATRLEAGDSGHIRFVVGTLEEFYERGALELLRGDGFGSVSTHRLSMTLFSELGIVGILLWSNITLFPYQVYRRVRIAKRRGETASMEVGLLGAAVCIVVGVNLYDYMMYPFIWIVFGFCGAFLRLGQSGTAREA